MCQASAHVADNDNSSRFTAEILSTFFNDGSLITNNF